MGVWVVLSWALVGGGAPVGDVLVAMPERVVASRVAESVWLVAPAGVDDVRWYVARPVAGDYDNTTGGTGARPRPVPIRYEWAELGELRGLWFVPALVVKELRGVGSHRLLACRGGPLPHPSSEDVARMAELVVRRGDDYVGRLTELIGTPFVYFPTRLGDGRHQTDARVGADCVATVVYGQRRLGRTVRYMAPGALRRHTSLVGDRDTAELRAGDVLHFGFQTAVVSVDTPPRGRLGDDDRIIHAYHGLVEEVEFGSLPYRRLPLEVRRWPSEARCRGGSRFAAVTK